MGAYFIQFNDMQCTVPSAPLLPPAHCVFKFHVHLRADRPTNQPTKPFLPNLSKPNTLWVLQMPERRPDYRRDRPHGAFLTRLKDHTRGVDRCVTFSRGVGTR